MKNIVIIPVYNAEKTIERAVKSVISNRINGEQIDIIIINDCSTDDTAEIISSLKTEYPGISIINTCENIGAGAARNVALAKLYQSCDKVYDYIFFLDADDYYTERFFTFFSKNISALPIIPELVLFRFNYFNEGEFIPYVPGFCPAHKSSYVNITNFNVFYSFGPCYRAHKFAFLKDNSFLFGHKPNNDDVLFSIMSILSAKNIYFLDKVANCISKRSDKTSLSSGLKSLNLEDKYARFIQSRHEINEELIFRNMASEDVVLLLDLYLVNLYFSADEIKSIKNKLSSDIQHSPDAIYYISMYINRNLYRLYRMIFSNSVPQKHHTLLGKIFGNHKD